MPLLAGKAEAAVDGTDFNLFAHFARQLRAAPNRELLATTDGRSFSAADIDAESARIAAGLASLGVAAGDRVSVQVEKSPASLCLYLACLRAGFVYHPLNTGYQKSELDFFFSDAEPAVVVCDPDKTALVDPLAQRAGARERLTLDAEGRGSLSDLAAASPERFADRPRARDDLAALLYSSGTTGRPKGIMLTHGNLLANTATLVDAWGFTATDRLLHALPIFHVHGLFVGLGCVLLAGASMRWLAGFDAAEVLRWLPECTVMMGVPTYYTRLLAQAGLDRESTANVRLFVSGSAPLLPETFAAFEQRTGQRILERYGMTETNMNTSNPLDGPRKPGTVGPPLPGVEVRVVGDDGCECATGEIGGIEVRGPNVFAGYWKLPEKTAEDFTADGYFRTGDLGSLDEDGYVAISGRAKDLIITGGLNVYPKEVEEFLDALPGIRESAVIGLPHADFGEAVVAVVVAKAAAAGGAPDIAAAERELMAACKADLAGFKVPKRILFTDELPRNTMGKVQKNLLRDRYADALAAAGADAT